MTDKTSKRPTRSDVAKEAGVTDTIVSYVVNDNRYVDPKKRVRVQEAIEKLGYRPNSIARALKGKTTNHILFVVDDIQSEHFGSIIKEIDQTAYNDGYFFSLCYDRGDDEFINRITDGFFDGLVIGSSSFYTKKIQKLIDLKIPVVLFEITDHGDLTGSFGRINTGLFDGACQCVKAVHKSGKTNIVYVGGEFKESDFEKANFEDFRYKGFMHQMDVLGLKVEKNNIVFGYKNNIVLRSRIQHLLEEENPPNAFICRTDSIACTVIEAINDMGLSIPNDVAVTGFNNSSICEFSKPKLTSVKIDRKGAGQKVLELIEILINQNEEKHYDVLLQTELIMRDSV